MIQNTNASKSEYIASELDSDWTETRTGYGSISTIPNKCLKNRLGISIDNCLMNKYLYKWANHKYGIN